MRPQLILGLLVLIAALVFLPSGGPKQAPKKTLSAPVAFVAHIDIPATGATPVPEMPDFPAPDPFEGSSNEASAMGPHDVLIDLVATDEAPAAAQEPVADPVPAAWRQVGPPSITAGDVLATASALLGVPYLWGGNTTLAMDCSAYVSRTWGVPRQTTDTLYTVAFPIGKEDLRPGDAMNLTKSQDPRGYGHVRLFAAWANTDHTRVWVYEETPRQSIYHVIAYDSRYTPMRRVNIGGSGQAAPLVPEPTAAPAPTRQPSPTHTPTATSPSVPRTATPTPRSAPSRTATPAQTPEATRTVAPSATPATPRPSPTRTVVAPTATPTALGPTATPTVVRAVSTPTPRTQRTGSWTTH